MEEKEKEDAGADRKEKGKEEEHRAMDPKEGWRYALGLDSVIAIVGESKGKSKGDKAVLDAVWGMGLKMDREVNGTQAWDAALQEATSMGCPDHLLAVKKKWEGWRTRLIDRRESAMIRVAGELEALKNQMAVVMSALDVAMPGQEKLAEKQKNKAVAAQRELDLAKQRKEEIRLLERRKKEEEDQELADAKKVMETEKMEAARKAELKERKIRKVAAECHPLEKEEEVLKAKNEEERKKAEKEAEEAKKEAEKEKERWRKAQNTPQQVVGEG